MYVQNHRLLVAEENGPRDGVGGIEGVGRRDAQKQSMRPLCAEALGKGEACQIMGTTLAVLSWCLGCEMANLL